jgi:DNA-binding response OmpR family regulator
MKKLIAAVDDEKDILRALKITLEKEGYEFKGFSDGQELFSFLKTKSPDLFVLDVLLPSISGLEILKQLRKDKRFEFTPTIFLSAKSSEFDKVLGLELGADDYVVKPFSLRELSARIKAALRKSSASIIVGDECVRPQSGITINKTALEVLIDGKRADLTLSEFKLLELFLGAPNRVFSRDELLNHRWGQEKIVTDRTIDFHIKNLRAKMGGYGGKIKNIRGAGYKYED